MNPLKHFLKKDITHSKNKLQIDKISKGMAYIGLKTPRLKLLLKTQPKPTRDEYSNNRKVSLYHGTAKQFVPNILVEGLKRGATPAGLNTQPWKKIVYVTTSPHSAKFFGNFHGEGKILKVKVPEEHLRIVSQEGEIRGPLPIASIRTFGKWGGNAPSQSYMGVEADIPPTDIRIVPSHTQTRIVAKDIRKYSRDDTDKLTEDMLTTEGLTHMFSDTTSENFTPHPRDKAYEVTAARKFGGLNINRLTKIGSGRDRDVYQLGTDKVLKIAKNPQGLKQNAQEQNLEYINDFNLKHYETGKDYVVMEKAEKAGKTTTKLLRPVRNAIRTAPFTRIGYSQHYEKDKDNPQIQEALEKAGLSEFRDYGEVSLADLTAQKNWGEKAGKPVLIDAGGLSAEAVRPSKYKAGVFGRGYLQDPEWREIRQERVKYKKKGALDKPTTNTYPEYPDTLANFPTLKIDDTSGNMAWAKGIDAENIPLAKGTFGTPNEPAYTKKRVIMPAATFLKRQYDQRPNNKTSTMSFEKWADIDAYDRKRIDSMKQTLLDPKKELPVPIEEYDVYGKRRDFQEGRHRGIAAQELGMKVPVILARKRTPPWDRIGPDPYKSKRFYGAEHIPKNTEWDTTINTFTTDPSMDRRFDMPVKARYPGRKGFEIKWYPTEDVLKRHKERDSDVDITNPSNQIGNRLPNAIAFIKDKGFMKENWEGGRVGFEPPLVNEKGSISDGRHRLLALKNLGYTEIPVEEYNPEIDDVSKDNQIYLDIENYPKHKNYIKKLPSLQKNFLRGIHGMKTQDALAYTTPTYPGITFMTENMRQINFNKPANIKMLSNILGHEETHSLLEREGLMEANSKFDNTTIPPIMHYTNKGNELEPLNPFSTGTIDFPSTTKKIYTDKTQYEPTEKIHLDIDTKRLKEEYEKPYKDTR